MTTVKLASKAGLKTAATGTLAGLAAAWFLGAVLTVTAEAVVWMTVLAAVAAAGYLAGVRAGGAQSDD